MDNIKKAFKGAIELKGVCFSEDNCTDKIQRLLAIEKDYKEYCVQKLFKNILDDLIFDQITSVWSWMRKITNSMFFKAYDMWHDFGLALNALVALGARLMRAYYEHTLSKLREAFFRHKSN